MEFTEKDLAEILDDTTKTITGDIKWVEDEDHSPSVEFRAEISCEKSGFPLFIRGSYNSIAQTLSYVIVHASSRRIYGLDLGKIHRNRSGENVGEKHKHKWTDLFQDHWAYEPQDITLPVSDPVGVWKEFCKEAGITHMGFMHMPPPIQQSLFYD